MRSLTTKLVLAFFLTSVAGVVLAALFIRQFVIQEFDAYVITQQRTMFINDMLDYYTAHGNWAGLPEWQRQQEALRQAAPAPNPPPPGAIPGIAPTHFGLTDPAGRLIVPIPPYRPGDMVDSALLAGGVPITVDSHVVAIVLTPSANPVRTVAENRYLQHTEQALAGAGAIMIAVALGLGLVLARRITRPVQELTAAAQGIAAGDLGRQVPVRSRDELGTLAGAFNHMSADLARATGLRRQMTADIAHDLRTPLTVIGGYLEALRDGVLPPTPARFTALHEETQHLLHLVEDLHTLSLADAGELPLLAEPVPPAHLLERAADAHRHQAAGQEVALSVEAPTALPPVRVDEEQMARVLDNLVTNALRYTPAGGRIALGAADTPGGVAITVRDTGSGIAPGELPHIFERFYRADPSRQQATGGSGLGLAIVHSIVTAHGGQVTVASTPGQGTCFTVTLPHQAGA